MADTHKLLVLVSDETQRQHVLTVLNFLGENSLAPVEGATAAGVGAARSLTASVPAVSLLDSTVGSEQLADTLASLHEWDPGMPVLLLGDNTGDLATGTSVIGGLALPLQYTRLVDELHRARVFREQFDLSRGRGQDEIKLFRTLVGQSGAVRSVRRMMSQVADTDTTVLILGESGTGKEVVARNLHEYSARRGGPFVPVNCGAIPGELLESELFGHEKGAFTGALSTRAGRFELARGGTLFLDEIGDMPLTMQVKLLRVLQERSFERVGGSQTLEADVRIICATHKNLEEMIAKDSFREDLYYRINVFPIEMPALRERLDDLALLINELVTRLERDQRQSVRFASSGIESLRRHPWAGNVRELANLVERMAIMHPGGVVGARDLPPKFRHLDEEEEQFEVPEIELATTAGSGVSAQAGLLPLNGLDLKEHIQEIEKSLIQQSLEDCGGVVARAADRLRLRRTTLVEKMRKYDLLNKDEVTSD